VDCISTQFGAKFYNQKLHDVSKLWLTDIVPDAVNDVRAIVYDTLNWQLVTISFVANGSEKYVVIGNFEDSTKLSYTTPCDTSFWGNLHLAGGYFFIDDVSLTEMPYQEPTLPNVFTPNNDGLNDVWTINLNGYEQVNCNVYNRWGIKVFETDTTIINWNARTTSGEACYDGTYFYTIQAINPYQEKKYYKGFIQLIR
jgi:gliding motility-associated-like protein